MSSPIIVALDLPTQDKALQLVQELSPVIDIFKVGSELFTSAGPDIVRSIRSTGASVFLDLKFHDIPNTVAKAMSAAARLDVQMMTLHTSGGSPMMKTAREAVDDTTHKLGLESPILLGVTILTSMSNHELSEIGMEENVAHQVTRLANLAVQSGLKGLVCSPLELAMLRQTLPEDTVLVTPGIRATSDAQDDQKRTLSARQALEAGATNIVIGRPITAAPNPREAAEAILKGLE